uniref:FtsJ-like methyltransferase n=1 Tax=Pithovirus LCPAC401 TaxID=2506595 RepID=A0A481Z9W8_9VIRU|nr:MAG: FtsJ-like methyltransferase [Pithovirus LCPAC401]
MDPTTFLSRDDEIRNIEGFKYIHSPPSSSPSLFYAEGRYERLLDERKIYDTSLFENMSTIVDPFSHLNQVFILDRGGLVMANLDSIFDITHSVTDFAAKRTIDKLSFIDIEGVPGGSIQYLQYRFMRSEGLGFAKRRGYKGSIGWHEIVTNKVVNNSEFDTTVMGDEMNGDVEIEWELFKEIVMRRYSKGVDLCSYHGNTKEGIFLCLSVIKKDKDIIIKMGDTVSLEDILLIHSISALFDEIYLIRLASTNKFSPDKYLVCKGKRKLDEEYIEIEPSEEFTTWITMINNLHIDDELYYIGEVKKAINGDYRPQYAVDLLRVLTLWHLPDLRMNKLVGYNLVYR